MKKLILALTVLFCAVVVISCSSNSPKGVVTKYFKAMQAKDYEKAADCFYYGEAEDAEAARTQLVALLTKAGKSLDEKNGLKSFEVTSVEENGDNAVVTGKITYGNGDVEENETTKTVKVDGNWYIDLDK